MITQTHTLQKAWLLEPQDTSPKTWLLEPEALSLWSKKVRDMATLRECLPTNIYYKELEKQKINRYKRNQPPLTFASPEEASLVESRILHSVKMLTKKEISAETLIEELSKDRRIQDFKEYFNLELQDPTEERIARLAKTFFSARLSSIQESVLGNDGVIILESVRAKNCPAGSSRDSCVLKWASCHEIASGEIYKLLFTNISVPEASILDFEKNHLISSDLFSGKPMGHHEAEIKTNLDAIRSLYTSKTVISENIIISEKAKGANLGDFASSEAWPNLTPAEKETIYEGLAEILLADLITGNTDRLHDVNYYDKSSPPTFDEYFAANIGNLLLQHIPEKSSCAITAIDNGIYINNILPGPAHDAYNLFLEATLSKSDWKEVCAEAIINSLIQSIDPRLSNYFASKNLTLEESAELVTDFEQFNTDLRLEATKQSLIAGLAKAKQTILAKIDSTVELDTKISEIQTRYNETENLCQVVKKRIEIFKNHRSIS